MSRQSAPFVIYISVDGLRTGDETRNLQALIDAGELPNFARLQREGAWTHNARTDPFHTNTIPNHSTMLTGRPVEDATGAPGHRYRNNTDTDEFPDVPVPGVNLSTLHTSAVEYIPSVFNVAHDRGYSTAVYASKTKFSLYDESYDGVDGPDDPAYERTAPAMDTFEEDNGFDKLDRYFQSGDVALVITRLVSDAASDGLADFSFVHIRFPDSAGHAHDWGSPEYLQGIRDADAQLGRIFALIDASPEYAGNTFLILTADHGGGGDVVIEDNHGSPVSPLNFTIPFYVWGPDVAAGADLYALNPERRVDPDASLNPQLVAIDRPIRNGDGGNLALDLLGLPAIPTSTLNEPQDLNPFAVVNVFGTPGADPLVGTSGPDGLHGEDGPDALSGGAGSDTLEGGDGDDLLNGGAGSDRINGGAGSDTAAYAGATAGVTVSLAIRGAQATGGAGTDRLIAVENLTGSGFADRLTGDAFANRLDGGAGRDVLTGGAGDDRYIVDNAADTVLELASGGRDTVFAGVNYTLSAEVEVLSLTGTAERGYGNASANTIFGNELANVLDGGAGVDRLVGGAGDDTYIVDHVSDRITEAAGGGRDTVFASVSHTLAPEVETLVLQGSATVGGGNASANTIFGNGMDNLLDGDAGVDTLVGGMGNDSYIVDHVGDRAIEAAGGGTDVVFASADHTLGEHVETLSLLGGAVRGTGNAQANTIFGNALDNVLSGGGGADVLSGRGGADTFRFVAVGDSTPGSSDRIIDFTHAQGDKIDLSAIDANSVGGAANDAFSFIGYTAFGGAGAPGRLRAHDNGDGTSTIEGDVDGDGFADFAVIVTTATLLVDGPGGDFIL